MGEELKNRLIYWIDAARGYSIPMSIMSWSIPFIFGITEKGNILYGMIALFGIIFAHAGVNLFDDFADFIITNKASSKEKHKQLFLQKGKCEYLINGSSTLAELLSRISVCFALAIICGIFLGLKCGNIVFLIMIIAGIIGILYPLLSFVALGEFAVAVMFAPLLYTGVYYVMTNTLSFELLPIAISTGLLTVGLLHAHMFLDYDFDVKNKKITLCSLAKNKNNAVRNQLIIMVCAYINIILWSIFYLPKFYLISILSFPTAIVLYSTMKKSIHFPDDEIKTNIFFGILENLPKYKKLNSLNFMIQFMTARNVMVEFTILICIAKILSENF